MNKTAADTHSQNSAISIFDTSQYDPNKSDDVASPHFPVHHLESSQHSISPSPEPLKGMNPGRLLPYKILASDKNVRIHAAVGGNEGYRAALVERIMT